MPSDATHASKHFATSEARRTYEEDSSIDLQAAKMDSNGSNEWESGRRKSEGDASLQPFGLDPQLLALFEGGPMGMALMDLNFRFVKVNRILCAMIGYSEEELLERTFPEVTHPDDMRQDLQQAELLRSGEIPHNQIEKRYIRRDGGFLWTKLTRYLIRDSRTLAPYFLTMVEDISERKLAEERLQASEKSARESAAEMAAVMQSTPALTYVTRDPECRTITGSFAAHDLMRVPRGRNTSKSAPPHELPTEFRVIKDGKEVPSNELPIQIAAATGVEVRDVELTLEFNDHTTASILGGAVPLFDEHGKVRGAVGAFVDITRRKKAEQELIEHGKRLEVAQKIAGLGLWEWDVRTRKSIWSKKVYEHLGLVPGGIEPSYEAFLSCVHVDDKDDVERVSNNALQTGQSFEYFYRCIREGQIHWMKNYVSVILDAEGTPIRFVGVTMEDRGREQMLQKKLAQAVIATQEEERGRIARELHDEAGQLLTSLLIGLKTMSTAKTLSEVKARTENLSQIAAGAMKELSRLVRGLQSSSVDDLGLAVTLLRLVSDLSTIWNIPISYYPGNTRWDDLPRETQLHLYRIVQEALTNIVKHSGADEVVIEANESDGYLRLMITDNGKGFDLYQYGNGIGLQNMRERASMMGGYTEIETAPGRGTKVFVRIPLLPQIEIVEKS